MKICRVIVALIYSSVDNITVASLRDTGLLIPIPQLINLQNQITESNTQLRAEMNQLRDEMTGQMNQLRALLINISNHLGVDSANSEN